MNRTHTRVSFYMLDSWVVYDQEPAMFPGKPVLPARTWCDVLIAFYRWNSELPHGRYPGQILPAKPVEDKEDVHVC